MSDIAVSVRNFTKTYRIFGHPGDRIKQALTFGRLRYHKEFTALKDVSFDIRKGETVGIIGRNGSGKSTLLQLICGILKPTSGTVQVNGRVSALLELGAGFNPEFTGRENVYFQGAVMGIAKQEMDARFDEIAAFADIGEFIDQPVRTYSSGMYVRLAFAAAINVEPDILVVDEALAVGDFLFQKRCYAKIRQMENAGLTLVIVSHDQEIVRNLTNRALLLDRGTAVFCGDSRQAVHHYRKIMFENEARSIAESEAGAVKPDSSGERREGEYGIGGAKIIGLRVLDSAGNPCTVFHPRERINLEMSVRFEMFLDQLNFAIVIRNAQGLKIYSWGSFNQDIAVWSGRQAGEVLWNRVFHSGQGATVTISIEANLGAGFYEVQAVVSRELEKQYSSQQVLHWCDEIGSFRVEMNPRDYVFGGVCDLRGRAILHD